MRINVTQEHIDKGQAGVCSACPIALAITGVIGHGRFVEVYQQYVVVDGKCLSLPFAASEFVRDFDHNARFADISQPAPFSFELEI